MLLALALAFMLRCKRTKKNSKSAMLISAFFMLGMAGGVLLIGGLGACIMLIMCAADFAQNEKLDKRLLLIFAVAVIGDLINALAPGNFAKRSLFGDIFITKSVAAAISAAAIEAKTMLLENGLLAFAAVAFVMGGACTQQKSEAYNLLGSSDWHDNYSGCYCISNDARL